LAVVFVCALAVRLIYLYDSADNPAFLRPIVDSDRYDSIARQWLRGDGMDTAFFWQAFFYPVYLSGMYALSDGSILFVKLFQCLLGAVTCGLTSAIAWRAFGRREGLVAGLITAFYAPLFAFEVELMTAGWDAFWAVLLVWLFIVTASGPRWWLLPVLGLIAGLAYLTRPTFLPPLLLCGIWLLIVQARMAIRTGQFVSVAAWLLFPLAACSAVLPVGLLSKDVTGEFRLVQAGSGINLYLGNNPHSMATEAARPWIGFERVSMLASQAGVDGLWERQAFFSQQAGRYLREQPLHALKGFGRRTLQFLSGREICEVVCSYLYADYSPLLQVLVWKAGPFGFPFGVVLPLAMVGLIFRFRQTPMPLWLMLAGYSGAVILVRVWARYRAPMAPLFIIAAAAGVIAMIDFARRRQWGPLVLSGLVVIAGICLSALPGPFRAEELNLRAAYHMALGERFGKEGDPTTAMEHYEEAIEQDPAFVPAHLNLATILYDQDRIEEAIGVYERIVTPELQSANVFFNAGLAYEKAGRMDKAREYYARAIELKPGEWRRHYRYAMVLIEHGKTKAAVEQLRRSLQGNPGFPPTWRNLGTALAKLRRFDEAIAALRKALELSPEDESAHQTLGILLVQKSDLDGALAHLNEAVRLDPYNQKSRDLLERVLTAKRARGD
jgi:Flp pilus assembly protein TadD